MTSRLKISSDGLGCWTFLLDRPEKRNALDEQFLSELMSASHNVAEDGNARLVILRSSSPTFCAGADLNDWIDITPSEARRLSSLGSRTFQMLADLPVPTIAAIEGPALGGGLELALACDLRIGTPNCVIGFPEPRLGNSPAWGGMHRLIEAIGKFRARDLLLTGDLVSGNEAYRVGILQRLKSSAEFQQGLNSLIESIISCDGGTLTYIKSVFGQPSQIIAAQEASMAGFTATYKASKTRKEAFLQSRRKQ